MTVGELAIEYRQSCNLIRNRVRDLKAALRKAEIVASESKLVELRYRISALTYIANETASVAIELEHYPVRRR